MHGGTTEKKTDIQIKKLEPKLLSKEEKQKAE
jgi:hypothetical protein